MRNSFFVFLLGLLFIPSLLSAQDYDLIWSEEFDSTELNRDLWSTWTGTAYNNEHQYYTGRSNNIFVEDGILNIVGIRESYAGRDWTSARIKSQDNFEFQYGKVEIRAKLPAGKGLWPAFWMLGGNIDEVGWPYSGEIDIMEYRGHNTDETMGTVHFSSVSPENSSGNSLEDRRYIGKSYTIQNQNFASEYHLFQFSWTDSLMIWSIDGTEFFQLTRSEIEQQTSYYPFDQPFYMILNLAIGGDFLGDLQPDETTPDTNRVLVDYVRVYQNSNKMPHIELPFQDTVQIEPQSSININPTVTDEDGEVRKVNFYLNDELKFTDNSAPYSFEWRASIIGCYNLKVEAIDNEKGVSLNERVKFIVGRGCERASFNEQPHEFPGTIELEHYDYGGQGISYYDTTPDSNLGNASGNDFRVNEAVDIIPDDNEDGNYLITNTAIGEWTTYELTIEQSGIYDIELRVVPGSGFGRINLSLDNEEWIYFTNIISQDGQYYTSKIVSEVELQKGAYDLKMEIVYSGNGLKPDNLKAVLKESTSTKEIIKEQPFTIRLHQNFPNPFNPSTNISFELPHAQQVQLSIYNALGQRVSTLHSGTLRSGSHLFTFEAQQLSSGIYYYMLETSEKVLTRKMLLLK